VHDFVWVADAPCQEALYRIQGVCVCGWVGGWVGVGVGVGVGVCACVAVCVCASVSLCVCVCVCVYGARALSLFL
jgi:hypothetical protein